jgi:integrase
MGKHTGRHRIPTSFFDGIAVREIRPGYFMTDMMRAGQRVRKAFNSIEGAKAWCHTKSLELTNSGTAALGITDAMRVEIVELRRMLGDRATLRQCVDYWMDKHPVEADGRTWGSVTVEYLKAMEKTNRRETSLADKRLKLSILGEAFGETAMKAIDKTDIEAKIEELATARGWSEGSKHAYRGAGLTLLRFYSGNGKRMLVKQDDDPPSTWSSSFVEKLLHTAEKVTPEIVAPLAVLLFAGCRPTETERLSWDHIRLADRIIMLPGSLTKTRRARNVQITDNLHAWLTAYKGTGPLIASPVRFRAMREELMKAVGLKAWETDTPRHTCATNMLASKGAVETANSLGHSAGVLMKHYAGNPPLPDAVKSYWNIMPTPQKNKA